MLVLSRKIGQELVIGDNIRIVVSRVAGNRVALGIEAPADVHIMRGELKAIREEFEEAAVSQPVVMSAPLALDAGFALTAVTVPR